VPAVLALGLCLALCQLQFSDTHYDLKIIQQTLPSRALSVCFVHCFALYIASLRLICLASLPCIPPHISALPLYLTFLPTLYLVTCLVPCLVDCLCFASLPHNSA
jgi:hypothetical protein